MAARLGFWKENSLSIVLFALFVTFVIGQILTGHAAWNKTLIEAGVPPIDVASYLQTGHFVGALFENWESEFLQMGMYVLLTVKLRQRGSAESRPMPGEPDDERVDAGPAPYPVRVGGLWKRLYAMSLSTTLLVMFVISFAAHAAGSWAHAVDESRLTHLRPPTLTEHLFGAEFWFESFQNWQSEFLAVLALVLLSIVLRQEHSPESKPLSAPHAQTGG